MTFIGDVTRSSPVSTLDGNKRLGWLATYVCCGVNGHDVTAPDDDAYNLIIGVAAGESDTVKSPSQCSVGQDFSTERAVNLD